MRKTFKFIIVAGLCSMTSGCFVAPLAGLAIKPILSFAPDLVEGDNGKSKGPISVDELLSSARGDAPASASMTPEEKAIAAAIAADAKPDGKPTTKAISVNELLIQARSEAKNQPRPSTTATATATTAGTKPKDKPAAKAISVDELLKQARSAAPKPARPATAAAPAQPAASTNTVEKLEAPLSEVLENGAAFLRAQMTINTWASAKHPLRVSLGAGDGSAKAVSMIAHINQLRELCRRLDNRCTVEQANLAPGLRAGWVRLMPANGGDNA